MSDVNPRNTELLRAYLLQIATLDTPSHEKVGALIGAAVALMKLEGRSEADLKTIMAYAWNQGHN